LTKIVLACLAASIFWDDFRASSLRLRARKPHQLLELVRRFLEFGKMVFAPDSTESRTSICSLLMFSDIYHPLRCSDFHKLLLVEAAAGGYSCFLKHAGPSCSRSSSFLLLGRAKAPKLPRGAAKAARQMISPRPPPFPQQQRCEHETSKGL